MLVRLAFIYFIMNDAGSAQDIRNYVRTARALGHEISVYGPRELGSPYNYSQDLEAVDAVVFIFEWTTQARFGDRLDLARIIDKVPRNRRVVIDCDGNYNDAITVRADYNHRDAASSEKWRAICDSLSDKICQPTLHPRLPNVRPFFFHGYDPAWEKPLDFVTKEFGMVYVGHSKFRWLPMYRVLRAIEPIRESVGRIAVVGHGWDTVPEWAAPMRMEDAYYTDTAYMQRLGVEIVPPISADQVVGWMSKALFNPVIYRPLFEDLQLVTCRTFETPGAATIPLFGLNQHYVTEIYGNVASELVLPHDQPDAKIADILRRPSHYGRIVECIRRQLAAKHSYAARLSELIEIAHA